MKELLEKNPIVAAVKNEEELNNAINSEVEIIFVLFGDIISISAISEKIEASKKIGIIHIDLVEGLANKEVCIKFIKEFTSFKGIISTKTTLVKMAKSNNLMAIQRLFIFDSISLKNVRSHMVDQCDAIEILPGVIPKVITKITKEYDKPVVAGGLISTKEEVIAALSAGATCVSTSLEEIWNM